MRQLAVIAAIVFGLAIGVASFVRYDLVSDFAQQANMSPWRLAVVPGMFAMLYALLLYQNAEARIRSISQSLSRGVLVALLTWLSFSMLMMWAWCSPESYSACFSNALLVSGMVGGGQLLIAALLSAAVVGWLIMNPPPVKRLEE